MEEYLAKRHKFRKHHEDKPLEEKTILHSGLTEFVLRTNTSCVPYFLISSCFAVKEPFDYQGRSFLHPPQDVGVNLRSDVPPSKCFLPKAHIHTWEGHTKGISAIRWFPKSAHLLLSSSMDCRVKVRSCCRLFPSRPLFRLLSYGTHIELTLIMFQIWEVYNERRCVRTYYGHRQAVRDICFNNEGTQFLSAGQ